MSTEGTTFDAGTRSEQAPAARAFVAVVEGAVPATVDLPAGHEVSIGRSHSSAVRLDDKAVSRLHATLRWDGAGTVWVTDHGSRNGTRLDGARIEGTVAAGRGSEIRIGDIVLVLGMSAPPARTADGPVDDELMLACDPTMLRTLALVDRAARTVSTVLLRGETGAGKELLARRIHELSARCEGPFVAVNAGTIPETLAESTLFGHERGAFTGATSRHRGCFESADGGTLFLDEVGELSLATQSRLLRVLEDDEVVRVGGTEPIRVDVRLVAATHRDVDAMVRAGTLREDLLYRLDVVRIEVPPLRERPEDVMPLAERFLAELASTRTLRLGDDAAAALRAYAWPGNVRELRNVIERAVAMTEGGAIGAADLQLGAEAGPRSGGALRNQVGSTEREAIVGALEACDGNRTHAAKRLGISRRTLLYKMEKHGLKEVPPSRR